MRKFVPFILIPILLTGCNWDEKETSQPIDPPPKAVEKRHLQTVQAGQSQKQEKTMEVELYYLSDDGYVVPYTVNLPQKKDIAKLALQYLVDKGPATSMIPKEFSGVLPAGTKIKGIKVKDKVATVNFSKQFHNYDAKTEEQMVSAITWSLTGFDSIQKVNLQVEGEPLSVMPKKKTPAQELTRENGINVEMASGVNISESMPVTLFFLGQTKENEIYYVPVTRMVERSENIGQAVLNELIKGPSQDSELIRALDASTELNQVKIQKDTVMADFGEQLLQYNNQKTASQSAIDSIVLSLTESTGTDKVKITVNGKQSVGVFAKDGRNLDTSITRPEKINPQKQ